MEGFLIDETTRTLALKTPVKSLDLGGREAGMYIFNAAEAGHFSISGHKSLPSSHPVASHKPEMVLGL